MNRAVKKCAELSGLALPEPPSAWQFPPGDDRLVSLPLPELTYLDGPGGDVGGDVSGGSGGGRRGGDGERHFSAAAESQSGRAGAFHAGSLRDDHRRHNEGADEVPTSLRRTSPAQKWRAGWQRVVDGLAQSVAAARKRAGDGAASGSSGSGAARLLRTLNAGRGAAGSALGRGMFVP